MNPCLRVIHRVALVAMLAAALGLGACGRKAWLDLPPGAAADSDAAALTSDATVEQPAPVPAPKSAKKLASPSDPDAAADKKNKIGTVSARQNMRPEKPKGEDKHIPLDVLID